jgi:hypothetical protein
MVLISIQPFAFKKIFLLVAALLCLSSAACFADSLFMSLHSASYNRQMTRIPPVFLAAGSGAFHQTCGAPAEHLTLNLRNVQMLIHDRSPINRMRYAWLRVETNDGPDVWDQPINRMACRFADIEQTSPIPLYALL